jgi:two-component system cell cycle response regulator
VAQDSPIRILVVDDEDKVCDFLKQILEAEGYYVITAKDGGHALRMFERQRPDLVLLDLMLPGLDGMDVLRILKSQEADGFVPVIMLTCRDDMESKLRGLKLGADDYLGKPVRRKELLARIDALLRIKKLHDESARSRRVLDMESYIDPVTGLYNADYLEQRLGEEFERAERYREPLSCILISLDSLAPAAVGASQEDLAAALKEMVTILQGTVREFDILVHSQTYRFVVILPRTHFTGSLAVASRIWSQATRTEVKLNGRSLNLKVNMGVAFYPNRDVNSAHALLQQAEQALKKSIQEGDNQICLFQQMAYLYNPVG